ncbi:hypothetical protein CDD82_5916 [Ophiocordyceps australis]|uniref:Uncharacterized protein n=1 Tax=Ophiocordyceps australis TaxID=1399860 RepID=A0A2C5YZT0_9HYPO|nr:hypothetical protein CDD82_5916 [Ophiocordyceps australis]
MKATIIFSAAFIGMAIANKTELFGRGLGSKAPAYLERPPMAQIAEQARKGLDALKGPYRESPTGGRSPMRHQPGGLPELRRSRKKDEGVPGTPGNPLGPRKKTDKSQLRDLTPSGRYSMGNYSPGDPRDSSSAGSRGYSPGSSKSYSSGSSRSFSPGSLRSYSSEGSRIYSSGRSRSHSSGPSTSYSSGGSTSHLSRGSMSYSLGDSSEPRRSRQNNYDPRGTPGSPRGPRKKPDRIYSNCGRKRDLCVPVSNKQLAALTDRIVGKEFPRLMKDNKQLTPTNSNGRKLTVTELCDQFRLNRKPKTVMIKRPAIRFASRVAGAAAIALYISDVISVFTTKGSTTQEMTSAIVSIIPILGCGYSYDEQIKVGRSIGIDIAFGLCIASDVALFVGPAGWIFYAVAKPIQIVIQFIEESSAEYLIRLCTSGWDNTFQELKESFASSHFIEYLQSRYSTEIAAALYVHAEQTALLQVGKVTMINSAKPSDMGMVEDKFDQGWKEIFAQTCSRINNIESQFQHLMTASTQATVADAREKYYYKFIETLRAQFLREAAFARDSFGDSVPTDDLVMEYNFKVDQVLRSKLDLRSHFFAVQQEEIRATVLASLRHVKVTYVKLCSTPYQTTLPAPPSDIRVDDIEADASQADDGQADGDQADDDQADDVEDANSDHDNGSSSNGDFKDGYFVYKDENGYDIEHKQTPDELPTFRQLVHGPRGQVYVPPPENVVVLRFYPRADFRGHCIEGVFRRGTCFPILVREAVTAASIFPVSSYNACRFFA